MSGFWSLSTLRHIYVKVADDGSWIVFLLVNAITGSCSTTHSAFFNPRKDQHIMSRESARICKEDYHGVSTWSCDLVASLACVGVIVQPPLVADALIRIIDGLNQLFYWERLPRWIQ
jgi:hypothetical protein